MKFTLAAAMALLVATASPSLAGEGKIAIRCAQNGDGPYRFVATQMSEGVFFHDDDAANKENLMAEALFEVAMFGKDDADDAAPTLVMQGVGKRIYNSFRIGAQTPEQQWIALTILSTNPAAADGDLFLGEAGDGHQMFVCDPVARLDN